MYAKYRYVRKHMIQDAGAQPVIPSCGSGVIIQVVSINGDAAPVEIDVTDEHLKDEDESMDVVTPGTEVRRQSITDRVKAFKKSGCQLVKKSITEGRERRQALNQLLKENLGLQDCDTEEEQDTSAPGSDTKIEEPKPTT